MQVWILTFNRPAALNRQIHTFGSLGYDVYIFSNHPLVQITEENQKYIKGGLYNTLSDPEASSYCARAWNNIFIKCFKTEYEGIFVQDDTYVRPSIKELLDNNTDKYDLIWGPAGDTFFYMKKSVLAQVGWFDERYLGCFCGDADFLKRVWIKYDRNRISVAETHDWGFYHNDIGIRNIIAWDHYSKCADQDYVNQYDDIGNKTKGNVLEVLHYSQNHFKKKWNTPGNGINGIGSMISYPDLPQFEEIDWYPWFTHNYLR